MEVNFSAKTMPYSLEAEQAVLGSVLIDRRCLNAIVEKVSSDDFYYEQNKIVYAAIIALSAQSKPIDLVTVGEELEREAQLSAVGGTDYLVRLATNIITTANLDYYIEILREKSMLRRLIQVAQQIEALSYDGNEEVNAILLKAEQLIYNVRDGKEIDLSLIHIYTVTRGRR